MSVKRLSNIKIQYDDGNGALASNYRLFFYASGSSSKQNTYNSSSGSVANSNPIVLNALGEPAVEIWLTEGLSYKVGLAIPGSDDPPASFVWTEDNISGVNDSTTSVDRWKASLLTPTFVSGTSFTLSGDQTTTFDIGRRLKTTNTAGTIYSTITASAFGASTTVTVVNDSGVLDAGLSAVSYGIETKTNDSLPRGIFTTMAQHRGYLSGLTMSTAGGSATMSIAAGVAVDSTNALAMSLASSISKTTSAWAVGTGNGGLDTGAIANSTWYHFYLIMRTDTQVVDVLFSLSASAPTMPANYTLKRRIGSGKTDGSAQWTAFVQDGDFFQWATNVVDVSATNPGAAAVTRTLTVPTGVNVIARLYVTGISDATAYHLLLSDLAVTDQSPVNNAQLVSNGTDVRDAPIDVRTNTSAQIRSRVSASAAGTVITINTVGWLDRRGRDA